MSALRDTIGVATALERSVAVTSEEASSAVTPRIPGKSGRSGTTKVCISATRVPLRASTAVMAEKDGYPSGRAMGHGILFLSIASNPRPGVKGK
jgi:hypothetical protein